MMIYGDVFTVMIEWMGMPKQNRDLALYIGLESSGTASHMVVCHH
jgi:hypothetical protein